MDMGKRDLKKEEEKREKRNKDARNEIDIFLLFPLLFACFLVE